MCLPIPHTVVHIKTIPKIHNCWQSPPLGDYATCVGYRLRCAGPAAYLPASRQFGHTESESTIDNGEGLPRLSAEVGALPTCSGCTLAEIELRRRKRERKRSATSRHSKTSNNVENCHKIFDFKISEMLCTNTVPHEAHFPSGYSLLTEKKNNNGNGKPPSAHRWSFHWFHHSFMKCAIQSQMG